MRHLHSCVRLRRQRHGWPPMAGRAWSERYCRGAGRKGKGDASRNRTPCPCAKAARAPPFRRPRKKAGSWDPAFCSLRPVPPLQETGGISSFGQASRSIREECGNRIAAGTVRRVAVLRELRLRMILS